jgi:hypothetical protein
MTQPKTITIKRLFALSRNKCSFPKCDTNLIDMTLNQVLGEICHIKAQNPGGPRYDHTQSDSERNDFNNLILLCPTHHKVIDSDEESYTVSRLQKIKNDHESKFKNQDYELSDALAQKFIDKIEVSISSETNVFNPVSSQFANVIQNFNSPIESAQLESFEDILESIHSGSETLSKTFSKTLKLAKKKWGY